MLCAVCCGICFGLVCFVVNVQLGLCGVLLFRVLCFELCVLRVVLCVL